MDEHLIGRFFSKIEKTSTCWLWTGYLTKDGYGHFRAVHRIYRAHRFSYLHHFGKIPNKMAVCHSCDVRSCVNPAHLFLGTWKDNTIDCIFKGRRARKLTADQVTEIRADQETSHRQMAKRFDVDPSLIRRIRLGKAWKIMPRTSSGAAFSIIS